MGKTAGKTGPKPDTATNIPSPLPNLTSLHTFLVRSHTLETSPSWEQTAEISSHLQQRSKPRVLQKECTAGEQIQQINYLSQYWQVISIDSAGIYWWRMGKQCVLFILYTHERDRKRSLLILLMSASRSIPQNKTAMISKDMIHFRKCNSSKLPIRWLKKYNTLATEQWQTGQKKKTLT